MAVKDGVLDAEFAWKSIQMLAAPDLDLQHYRSCAIMIFIKYFNGCAVFAHRVPIVQETFNLFTSPYF
jgi:hypothetical protein